MTFKAFWKRTLRHSKIDFLNIPENHANLRNCPDSSSTNFQTKFEKLLPSCLASKYESPSSSPPPSNKKKKQAGLFQLCISVHTENIIKPGVLKRELWLSKLNGWL